VGFMLNAMEIKLTVICVPKVKIMNLVVPIGGTTGSLGIHLKTINNIKPPTIATRRYT